MEAPVNMKFCSCPPKMHIYGIVSWCQASTQRKETCMMVNVKCVN